MKTHLFLFLICSLTFSQGSASNSELESFLLQSKLYFVTQIYQKPERPFKSNFLKNIQKHPQITSLSSKKQMHFYHYLFRFYNEKNDDQAVEFGLKSYRIAQRHLTEKRCEDCVYISGYYQYYVAKFGWWTKTKYLFSAIESDTESGLHHLLKPVGITNECYEQSLYEQQKLYLSQKSDYPKAKSLLEELIKRFPHSEKLMSEYMNVVFQSGFFEDALRVLNPLIETATTDLERHQLLEYLSECYYYLGYFDISTQYFLQTMLSDSTNTHSKESLFLTKLEYMANDTIQETEWEKKLHPDSKAIIFKFKEEIRTPFARELKKLECYLNRSDRKSATLLIDNLAFYKMTEPTDQVYFQFLKAKYLWLEKDYFNAKRYLHNLRNQFEPLKPRLNTMVDLMLADIAYRSNDYNQSLSYLNEIDLNKLPFYETHRYHYLRHFLKGL